MEKIRTLIVDDERLARAELKRMLKEYEDQLEIIGEASNGNEAVEMVSKMKPDLLFLDIQMPGKNGFEVLENLPEGGFEVIFTTAYDEYALKAFDYSASDYLLKPIDSQRLNQAIQRVMDGEEVQDEPLVEKKKLGRDDKIFVKDGNNYFFIPLREVKLLESVGNYVKIHAPSGKPMILRSLNSMNDILDPNTFFRANRQLMVNTDFIKELEPYFSGSLIATLTTGEKIEFSRRQTARFKSQFEL